MYEVILYAAIATVVCVMFYSVLGRSVGKGPEDAIDPENYIGLKEKNGLSVVTPISPEMESIGVAAIAKKDPNFSPVHFVDIAKQVYSMVLEAYAAGDKDTLSNLLSKETYLAYEEAIVARETAGHKQVTDLGRLRKTSIKEASLDGNIATIAVLYEADLTSALLDDEGHVVQGDPDILSSISEVWTFERNLKSSDPTWRLSDVEPSEGDTFEADPTPDTKPSA